MNSKWKAVLGVSLIFVLGFVAGIFCTSIVVWHKAALMLRHPAVALSNAIERRLTAGLNLDPNQKQQIHGYFQENLQQRRELQKQIQPQVQALNQQTYMEINSVLRPDQVQTFQKNVEEFRKRMAEATSDQSNP
jgi:sensor histidine kinase YesM